MKTAIIVDSSAYLSKSAVEAYEDLFVIPMTVNFPDGRTMVDSSSEEALREFFDICEEHSDLPTTSQPAIGNYYNLLEELASAGYERVFALHMPGVLSGVSSTARLVAKDFEDQMEIHAIDTRRISIVVEYMVEEVYQAIRRGASSEEILNLINYIADHSIIYLSVDTLDNLEKGGRLSSTGAKIGALMQIKPIVVIEGEGEITLKQVVRGSKKARRKMLQLVREAKEKMPVPSLIKIAHAEAGEEVSQVIEVLQEEFPAEEITVSILGPVVATHTGPASYGIAIIPRI